MNTQHNSISESNHYLDSAEDRKTFSMLLTAVYSPLLLMLGAALFLA